MKVTCDFCGKLFNAKPSRLKRSKTVCCSKECADKLKIGVKKVEHLPNYSCDYCGKPIFVHESKLKQKEEGKFKGFYCDRKCLAKYQANVFKAEMVKINCPVCQKDFTVKKSDAKRRKYCSQKCLYEARKVRVDVKCDYCGKIFKKKPSQIHDHNFCKKECSSNWNSKTKNIQRRVKCVTCGKTFVVQNNRKNAKNCSKECRYKWIKNVYSKDKNVRKRLAKQGVKACKTMKKSMTNPEKFVMSVLKDSGLNFIPQKVLYEKFVVDFYFPDSKTVIEVNGDYWHANPVFYNSDNANVHQIKQTKKDKARLSYLKKCGHEVLVVWENDINNNPEFVKEYILTNAK